MQILIRNFHHKSCLIVRSVETCLKRCIGTKIYQQLSTKGLLCSHFPDNIDVNDLLNKKQTIYAGFDATNQSLHVGNLLVLVSLFHLYSHGHRIIVLIGDATARIGDPSGKITERPMLDDVQVDLNADGIENDVKRVLENYRTYFNKNKLGDEKEFLICRNGTWYKNLNVIDFVNKYARHMRMGDMLSKNAIKQRLKSPTGLNFAEFSYQTFQAYDWYYLFKKYGCQFQVGGVDQTVNIHNGYDLIKKIQQKLSYGLFVPLITDDRGNKIGKSEGKAIFLNPEMTTPFGLYQYFMRIPDSNIHRFLRLFSFRPLNEIENMIQNQMKNPQPWRLQKKLAEEMTLLVHGPTGLEKAQKITKALFEKNLEQLAGLNEDEIRDVFDGVPVFHLEFCPDQTTMLDLAMKSGFFDAELDAIQRIKEGGFYVNYTRETDPSKVLNQIGEKQHVLDNGITIVSLGKRNHKLIRWL